MARRQFDGMSTSRAATPRTGYLAGVPEHVEITPQRTAGWLSIEQAVAAYALSERDLRALIRQGSILAHAVADSGSRHWSYEVVPPQAPPQAPPPAAAPETRATPEPDARHAPPPPPHLPVVTERSPGYLPLDDYAALMHMQRRTVQHMLRDPQSGIDAHVVRRGTRWFYEIAAPDRAAEPITPNFEARLAQLAEQIGLLDARILGLLDGQERVHRALQDRIMELERNAARIVRLEEQTIAFVRTSTQQHTEIDRRLDDGERALTQRQRDVGDLAARLTEHERVLNTHLAATEELAARTDARLDHLEMIGQRAEAGGMEFSTLIRALEASVAALDAGHGDHEQRIAMLEHDTELDAMLPRITRLEQQVTSQRDSGNNATLLREIFTAMSAELRDARVQAVRDAEAIGHARMQDEAQQALLDGQETTIAALEARIAQLEAPRDPTPDEQRPPRFRWMEPRR